MILRNNFGKLKIIERSDFIDDTSYNSYIYLLNYQKYKNFENITSNKCKNSNYSLSVINNFLHNETNKISHKHP